MKNVLSLFVKKYLCEGNNSAGHQRLTEPYSHRLRISCKSTSSPLQIEKRACFPNVNFTFSFKHLSSFEWRKTNFVKFEWGHPELQKVELEQEATNKLTNKRTDKQTAF